MINEILVVFTQTATVTLSYLWIVLLFVSLFVNLPSYKVVDISVLSWHLWLWNPEMLSWLLASSQIITVLDSWEMGGIRWPCGGWWGQEGQHQQRQWGNLQKNQVSHLRSSSGQGFWGHLWLVLSRTLDLLVLAFCSEEVGLKIECDTMERDPWCCGFHTATRLGWMISVPCPMLQQWWPIHFIVYCCHRSGLLSFLSHVPEFSEHGIWTKALNIYPASEGDFSFNAIEIIALNNRVTVIHWGCIKLLILNSGNVSEIGWYSIYMLSIHYIITFWQREGLRKWKKTVPKSQQYIIGALNTYLHFKKKI